MIQIITTQEGIQEVFDKAFEEALKKFGLAEPNNKPLSPATRVEGSKFLGLSLPTFDTLLRTNQIKSFRIGRQVRINWSDLELYLEKKRGGLVMKQNKKGPGKGALSSLKTVQGDKNNKAKYTKYQREVKEVKAFLAKHTATQTMVSVALGIYRPNLCRIKRELQDLGVLVEVRKGICKETGHRAAYLTCNPQLIQEMKKGGQHESN